MRYFVDNCVSPRIARALDALSQPTHSVEHLQDMYPPDTTDVEWLTDLGKQGKWVVISGDFRIAKSPQNRQAWELSGLTAFFLKKGWTNQKLWDQAWRLVRWWPRILATAQTLAPGLGYQVPVNPTGKLELVGFKKS